MMLIIQSDLSKCIFLEGIKNYDAMLISNLGRISSFKGAIPGIAKKAQIEFMKSDYGWTLAEMHRQPITK